MLLCELDPNTDLKDVDLLDDLHFFIGNDPQFYRKVVHPIVIALRKHLKGDKPCDHSMFIPAVDTAVNEYCKKFKIDGNPKSIFTAVDRDELARKIFDQHAEHINKQKDDTPNHYFESDKGLEKSLDPLTRRELKHIAKRHPHESDELSAFIADTEERLEHLEGEQRHDANELKIMKNKIMALSAAIDRVKSK